MQPSLLRVLLYPKFVVVRYYSNFIRTINVIRTKSYSSFIRRSKFIIEINIFPVFAENLSNFSSEAVEREFVEFGANEISRTRISNRDR